MTQAPDTLVVTGPNFEQEPLDLALVTPTGGVQLTLRDALAFGANLSMPPPIGNVIPNTGAFTTLSGSVTSTGSNTPRTLADRFADYVYLKDYGAKGDRVTDDTAAIQAAVIAAQYKTLIVEIGRYVISSTITIVGPIVIQGMGNGGGPGEVSEPGPPTPNVSEFICKTTFTSGDMFYCPSEYPVSFRDIQLSSHVSLNFLTITDRGAGAAIHLVGANTIGGTNACTSIENVSFSGFDVCVYLERCADTRITQCYFQAWKTAAIDAGTGGFVVESSPGFIAFNKFFGDPTVGTGQQFGIRVSSGYGAISYNLMVGSRIGIQVNANDLVNIGSMMISWNSIEEQSIRGINVVQSGTTTINAIQINNNELSNLTNTLIASHIRITGATQANIKTFSITGNKFQSFLTGGAGICIEVQCGTTGMISENLFNITGCYGIAIGPIVSVDVFDNKINGSGLLGTAGYFFNAPANVVVRDTSTRGIGASSIPNLADGSSLYIFDGQATPNSNVVTGGGTGCVIWRIGGAWLTIPNPIVSIDAVPIGGTTPSTIVGTSIRTLSTAGPTWTAGTGAPGTTQPLGSTYSRTDGGVGTTLYVSRGAGTWNPVAGV